MGDDVCFNALHVIRMPDEKLLELLEKYYNGGILLGAEYSFNAHLSIWVIHFYLD